MRCCPVLPYQQKSEQSRGVPDPIPYGISKAVSGTRNTAGVREPLLGAATSLKGIDHRINGLLTPYCFLFMALSP